MPYILSIIGFLALGGCSPTVKVQSPDKPITINLNVKLDHQIRVKMDKAIDNMLADEELFGG
jgi:hypothetical protein